MNQMTKEDVLTSMDRIIKGNNSIKSTVWDAGMASAVQHVIRDMEVEILNLGRLGQAPPLKIRIDVDEGNKEDDPWE